MKPCDFAEVDRKPGFKLKRTKINRSLATRKKKRLSLKEGEEVKEVGWEKSKKILYRMREVMG